LAKKLFYPVVYQEDDDVSINKKYRYRAGGYSFLFVLREEKKRVKSSVVPE